MLATVTGTGIGNDHAHAIFGDFESFRELALDAEGSLSSGPDRQFSIAPFGDCGARLQRSVSDVGDCVSSVKFVIGGFEALLQRAVFRPWLARSAAVGLRRMTLEVGEQVFIRRLWSGLP